MGTHAKYAKKELGEARGEAKRGQERPGEGKILSILCESGDQFSKGGSGTTYFANVLTHP